MNSVRNREVRAIEYRRLALQALALAGSSGLNHVREKHELAAARWMALATMDERPVAAGQTSIAHYPDATAGPTDSP